MLYLPLFLLFVAGLLFATRRLFATRGRGWEPELLAGAVFSYLSISFLRLDDPRYLLPWLVYVAVIAVAWIPGLPRPGRLALAGVLVAVLVMNTAVQNAGIGSEARLSLWEHDSNPIGEAELVVLSPVGYTGIGEPRREENGVRGLLESARADGARAVAFDLASINAAGLHPNGMAVEARSAGLDVAGYDAAAELEPQDAYVFLDDARPERPCARAEGRRVYMSRGGPPAPANPMRCPSPG
jgi:hypothetical protein